MSIQTTYPHGTEEYYCIKCNSFIEKENITNNWKCSVCKKTVRIRLKTENKDNECFRVKIKKLKKGDLILLNRKDKFREVLNVEKDNSNKNNIRIAIKEYSVISENKNRLILKLNGGWFHNKEINDKD